MSEAMAGTGKETRPLHWAWIILTICFFDLFVNYSVRLGYGVILPEMIRDLSFTRTAAGSIFNAYLFTYIAFTPLAGYLTDRIGARRVITVCLFILSAGILLMGTVRSLSAALLFYAVAGLGAAGLWTPVITVVQRWFAPTHRGRALGVLSTGYGLGFAAMGIFFPWVVHAFSWRYAWYFLGLGASFMAVLNGFLLRSDPASAGHRPWGTGKTATGDTSDTADTPERGFVEEVLRNRTFWLIGLSYLCISYSLYGITTFMVDYAKDEIGFSLERASFLATVHGICQVAGVLTILPLSDYLGRKKTILLSNLFITVAIAGILFSGGAWRALCIFVGMMAVFYGVTFPIYGACAGDYFPGKWMGTVIGAWTPFYGLGAILAHWAGGMLRDASGSYSGAFMINMVLAGLAFLIFCGVGSVGKEEVKKMRS
jgi:sugar phosphate permease